MLSSSSVSMGTLKRLVQINPGGMHSPLVAFLTPVAFTLPGGAVRTFQVLLEGNPGPVWEGHLAGSQRVLWEPYSGERQHTEEMGGSFFKKSFSKIFS